MPDITDQEIEDAAKELCSNIPIWSKNLMKSSKLQNKAARFLVDLSVKFMTGMSPTELGSMIVTNMTAAMSIGYLIGYKHAKTEILQKI